MAINLSYTTPASGALASYHVISSIQIDYVAQQTNVQVASYVDSTAYQANKIAVYAQGIAIAGVPDPTQDPLVTTQEALTASAPVTPPASNRYTFAGGSLVDMPSTYTPPASTTGATTS